MRLLAVLGLLAVLVLIAPCAKGLDVPEKSTADGRIQKVAFNSDDVVEITAAVGTATHIVLGEGESVLDIASGFSAGWEVRYSRNNIYLKPKTVDAGGGGVRSGNTGGGSAVTLLQPEAGLWDTNLAVTTNKYTYSFQLVLLSSGDKRKPAFRVVFTYPEEEKAKAGKEDERQKVQEKLDQEAIPRNWNYTMQSGDNSADIVPTQAWDDGRFTYLQFPGNREFPAVFYVSQDKGESLVDVHVDPKHPDILVVHRVARELVLRLSNQVVSIYNEDFDSYGNPPTAGTTKEGVQRRLRSETGKLVQELEEIPSNITGAPLEFIVSPQRIAPGEELK
jgi:P-type conjugative transfer protein VirB9